MLRSILITSALAIALSSCGSSGHAEGLVSTQSALAALRKAGFRHLAVSSAVTAYEEARRLHPKVFAKLRPADVDVIVAERVLPVFAFRRAKHRQRPTPLLATPEFLPLWLVRYPSAPAARKSYKRGYSPRAIRTQVRDVRRFHILPRDFRAKWLRTARVCNLIIASYDPRPSRAFTARLKRAIALLRKRCR
jgi:hypothetical protein